MALTAAEEKELLLLLELEEQDRDIIAWVGGQGIRNEKKELMEFDSHRFLIDI